MRVWLIGGAALAVLVALAWASDRDDTADTESPPAATAAASDQGAAHYSPDDVWGDYGRYGSLIDSTDGAQLDADGIPVVPGADGKQIHNPLFVAQWGLQQWDYHVLGKDEEGLDRAITAADWLIDALEPTGGVPYEVASTVPGLPSVELEPGWVSASAQGAMLSLLARLWKETGDERFREAGELALRPFSETVAGGGVRQDAPQGSGAWYEEFPSTPPSYSLNGFQLALIGLYDWHRLTGSSEARELFEEGLAGLEDSLMLFDLGNRSAHDLGYRTAGGQAYDSEWYHQVNTRNLLWLSLIEPESRTIRRYRDRWQEDPDCENAKGRVVCFTIQ